jgi:hypothetical protein
VPFVHVVLVETGFGTGAVVSVSLVDVALLSPNPKCGGFVIGEIKGGDGYFGCFVMACMYEFKGFLWNNLGENGWLKNIG